MDEFDDESKRLLPCREYCGEIHEVDCPVEFRDAVAAALREQRKQIADFRAEVDRLQKLLGVL